MLAPGLSVYRQRLEQASARAAVDIACDRSPQGKEVDDTPACSFPYLLRTPAHPSYHPSWRQVRRLPHSREPLASARRDTKS